MLTVAPPERGAPRIEPGCSARPVGTVVLAAIDDDIDTGPVLTYARTQAARRGVPLRVVHVWARPRLPMEEADRLTADRIAEHIPEVAGAVERQILHDADPARALITLSREAVLLVVGAQPDGALGGTARQLVGRTSCPLALVPGAPVTRGRW